MNSRIEKLQREKDFERQKILSIEKQVTKAYLDKKDYDELELV